MKNHIWLISYKGAKIGAFNIFKELCQTVDIPFNTLRKRTNQDTIQHGSYTIEKINFRTIKKH